MIFTYFYAHKNLFLLLSQPNFLSTMTKILYLKPQTEVIKAREDTELLASSIVAATMDETFEEETWSRELSDILNVFIFE